MQIALGHPYRVLPVQLSPIITSPSPPLPSAFHSLIIPITTSIMSLPHAAAPPVRHPPFNRREIRHVMGGHAPSLTCAAYVMCVITIASRSCSPSTLLSFSTVCACIYSTRCHHAAAV